MSDIKACIACLSTTSKMFNVDVGYLRRDYNLVSGLKTYKGNGMPDHICFECRNLILKCKQFREKCHRSNYAIQEMINKTKQLQLINISSINRFKIGINSPLGYFSTSQMCYEEIVFDENCEAKSTPKELGNIEIPIFIFNTYSNFSGNVYFEGTQNAVKEEQEDLNYVLEFESLGYGDGHNSDFFDDIPVAKLDESHESKTETFLEYVIVPLTFEEACAAHSILQMNQTGQFVCQLCSKRFPIKSALKQHERMHDKYLRGLFACKICHNHYKTEMMLNVHVKDKHNKYLCTKCNEVNFDRSSAKYHYTYQHTKKETKPVKPTKCTGKPKRLTSGKNKKDVTPADYPRCYVQSQEEQYQLVIDRKNSRNYMESPFKCDLCYKGFRVKVTYQTHMKNHDPAISGNYQCDMCKVFTKNTRALYKHMNRAHIFKYECRICKYQCCSRGQANAHYKFHKNVKYECPHCDLVFNKPSTQMTHIRLKHPSTVLCKLCGHSFVSEAGMATHQRKAHMDQELSWCAETVVDKSSALYCAECDVQLLSQDAYDTHLHTSSKHCTVNTGSQIRGRVSNRSRRRAHSNEEEEDGKRRRKKRETSEVHNNGIATSTTCEICGEHLKNDVQANKHYREQHPGAEFLKRYMCDVCGHATKQYANLVVHMRTHTRERPYACPHCDRRFSMPSNRDRHILVHTGEKRYECQHCHRRFSQSSAVKLHIQTVHMKIPYAPWDKKNRKRKKEMENLLPISEPKLMVETAGDYINTYVTYTE